MDLKTYAVFRKLNQNSDLLKYIIKQQDVPIDVVQSNFQSILNDLHDDDAEQIVNNYQKYLQEHVQMNFVPDGKNELNVTGEIDEPVMEAIESLHNVQRKDVVHDLIYNVMDNLRGQRDVQIDNIDLTASAQAFVRKTKEPIFNPHTDAYDQQVEQSIPDNEQPVETSVEQPEVPEMIHDLPSESEPVIHDAATQTNINYLNQSLPPMDIQADAPIFENPDDELADDAELADEAELADDVNTEPTDNPFKKAYDFLVQEIKDRQIDSRLPGLHLA